MKHDKPPFRKIRLYLLIGAVYVFASIATFSLPARAANDDVFAQTVDLMVDENWVAAKDSVIRANDVTLARIYEWMLYREDGVTGLPFDRVAAFIRNHPNWPEINKIRATAERVIPDDYPDNHIITWFKSYPPVTGQGYINFLSALNRNNLLNANAVTIFGAWPKLKATQSEQNAILQQIGRQIPIAYHTERFDRLLRNEQYSLARDLARFLGSGYPELIEARIALMEDKAGVSTLVSRVPANLYANAGFILDRVRWREDRDDDQGAIALLNELPRSSKTQITFPEDWWKERHILTRRLIAVGDFNGAYQLASRHGLSYGTEFSEAEWLSGWIALRFLNKPEQALNHFINMYGNVNTAISKARAAYWAGRAAERTVTADNSSLTWFEVAAKYPHTYYGQLAVKHLGRGHVAPVMAVSSAADYAAIERNQLVQASIKMRYTKYDKISASFLKSALESMTNAGEFMAFAETLSRNNDMSGAYRVAKAASWKNIILGAYYTPSLEYMMAGINVDNALMHAVIRQESQFDKNAQSPAGALGLAQLMPPTAMEVAERNNLDYNDNWLTSRPEYNIKIGALYMGKLLNKFNGSYPLAIAAYNAGPRRVSQWLEEYGDPRTGAVDWVDWVEMIPVPETRNYVQRVTEGVVMYGGSKR